MYKMTLNQFAEYSSVGTDKAKIRIINQQISPNKLLILWHQLAKGAIKKYLENINDISPLEKAIGRLETKDIENKRQLIDKKVSIEALERIIKLNISKYFKGYQYEVIKSKLNSVTIDGVIITISPEVIIKIVIDGNTIYVGVKIHISKSKPFDYRQCQYSSVLLNKYILDNFAKKGEFVLPELCLTIDVFSNRVVPAKEDCSLEISHIKFICDDIKARWPIGS